ncbi:glycerate kinase [Nakamurella flavida]|uniref:Glycerate kinase n=1 Tax=Nakamurella flavida TaxID=363630 RepID=A0A938YNA1_9ACTN|nr:glycerate kinase [Nakamurella flavida]MBM9477858.1 glycerate kinase [Nakamurella flavida]MDP9779413.1 glycerate kinase [Nakamurella flavida]
MTLVLIAPDKFKGSLPAAGVAAAVALGLADARPDVRTRQVPVADGGDGTIEAALAAGYRWVPVRAAGPTGDPVDTGYARRGSSAVLELATVSGLAQLPGGTLAPMTASSRGFGELIAAALDAGCTDLVLGIGGSACTDGGAGMIAALGARLTGPDGRVLADGGGPLADLAAVDLTALHPGLAAATVTVASDVDNPLTGPSGAAAVYGPQKGAAPAQVAELDRALDLLADRIAAATGADLRTTPGAGAAGGVGFAAVAVLGAALAPGIDLLLELVGFADALAGVDLVITGEGSLDEQSLSGKAPIGVATVAGARGIPVVAVCGRSLLTPERAAAAGIRAVYALTDIEADVTRCIAGAAGLLRELSATLAREQLLPSGDPA